MQLRNIPVWCLILFVFTVSVFGQKKEFPVLENHKPLVDFTDWTVEKNGKWKDKTGKIFLKPGSTLQECRGPLGGRAMYFDGFKTSISTIELGKTNKFFDGFEYTLSFWFRCDQIQAFRNDARLSNNIPGLGVSMWGNGTGASFNMRGVGANLGAGFGINPYRWNHVAVVYAVEKRIRQIYVNGEPVVDTFGSGEYFPLERFRNGRISIGMFKGAIADIQMWDKPMDIKKLIQFKMTKDALDDLYDQADQLLKKTDSAPAAKIMNEFLKKEIEALAASKKGFTLAEYNGVLRRLRSAARLIPAINALKKTVYHNTPYAFMSVRAISGEIRNPLTYPSDPVYSEEVIAIAAKDEYTSSSFMIFPYRDIKKIEFELADLKGPGGAIIPKEEIELKFVQAWFQPGWNTYFNGHGSYNPALLLNDPELLRIDEKKRINYLRFYYPEGIEYHNICIPGSVLKHPAFKWGFEPVWDADTLQPIPCDFGKNRQFWMDIHAPKDAKAGIYRGRMKIKIDGVESGGFTLALRVLPFELPRPKTQFDHSKPFTQYLASSMQIGNLTSVLKDREKAKELTWRHIINQKKHSIFMQPFSLNPNDTWEFHETLKMHKKAGLDINFVSAGAGFAVFAVPGGPPLHVVATVERVAEELDKFDKKVQKVAEITDKYLDGRRDIIFFYGMDEAQSAGSLRQMMPFRDYAIRAGMQSMTTGWEDNFRNSPSHETYHTTAAYVDRRNADKWHSIKGEITTYAAPFIGPDNPDLMRRSHGLRIYRSNYNGWWELAYSSGAYHTWNHLFGYDTTYRPFRFVIDTHRGPIINTIAFCGMREGQDDVRYATLMHQLIDECFASDDLAKIQEGRKALVWFRNLPMPVPDDLYAVRAGMIHYILHLMKVLGKPMV